jgi:DNA-binding Lrp family transcriptional regulator
MAMPMRLLEKIKTVWNVRSQRQTAKSFADDQQKEHAFETIDRGIQRVALGQIVGSVGRYMDFDIQFRPKHHMATERYNDIKQALREGRSLPPVKLYQIKDKFYVLDGNHRIAAAKALHHSDIRANIIEFIAGKKTLENILYYQRSQFTEKTGLPYTISLTELGQYNHLLNQISLHQNALEKAGAKPVAFAQAAHDWYETIYRPLLSIIRKGNIIKLFPKRTLDDLYAYISYHQWEAGKKRKYGIGIDRLIPNDMEAFRKKMATTSESNYPEMLRKITAFVLMKVTGKSEQPIMQRLFALKEVQEIHAIHGDADLLVKIVLTRDLLSSDAEIISEFVHDQMRQIPGVVSTQTLIPGRSMIRDASNAPS